MADEKNKLHVGVVSIFPEMFGPFVQCGITGRAAASGVLRVDCWNPRDFTADPHRRVDDRPYGGGPGMVMEAAPLIGAVQAAKAAMDGPVGVIYLSPQGRPLDQAGVRTLAVRERLILVCGRYEGVDERFIRLAVDEEWSVGDYVLSGGEVAAMVLIDAAARWLPGTLGHEDSAEQDSFTDGVLDCPHYTRPAVVEGLRVPTVLMSGHHGDIARWRRQQALGQTWRKRPDLLRDLCLAETDRALLDGFVADTVQESQ